MYIYTNGKLMCERINICLYEIKVINIDINNSKITVVFGMIHSSYDEFCRIWITPNKLDAWMIAIYLY